MKRGYRTTMAVVLNSFDYGESDRIIALYTEDYGKVKGIAKGARRSRRRFVNNLEPLSHIRVTFFQKETSELVRIEEAKLIDGFLALRADIEGLTQGCYLLELVSEMTREGQRNPRVYTLLVDFLRMMERAGKDSPLKLFFGIRLLRLLGLMPHLTGCVLCRKEPSVPGTGGNVYFSSAKGGMVCDGCKDRAQGALRVSAGTIKILHLASRFDASKLERLKAGDYFVKEGERMLDDFITYQLGKELKTKRFFDKLRAMEPGAGEGSAVGVRRSP